MKSGLRQTFDRGLLQRGGVALGGTVLPFYPEKTESSLAQLGAQQAKRSVKKIRRAFFEVRKVGNAYEFKVDRQLLF